MSDEPKYCWELFPMKHQAQLETNEIRRRGIERWITDHMRDCDQCRRAELARQGEIIRAAKGEEVEARR